ncbi:MAG: hypothetical protein O4859_21765 [Trichodesmium sp. St18_bin1]|jgi:hypothetical protein|nr:hypothetical protein [Trichodesmium sp. St18_bin1]
MTIRFNEALKHNLRRIMEKYSLPIGNIQTLIDLINSSKTPEEIHTAPNITVLWFRLSELEEIEKHNDDDSIALKEILTNKNICIIARKSDYFSLGYDIDEEFFTIKKDGERFILTDLCEKEVIVEEREVYISPLRIQSFQVDDIIGY